MAMGKNVKISENFRGLFYEPSSENEVLILFGMLLPYLDDQFGIDEYTGEFPDCKATHKGRSIGIEFELYSSKFYAHKHHLDPRLPKCDMIVCWKNNLGRNKLKIGEQTIEIYTPLSKIIDKKGLNGFILNKAPKPGKEGAWTQEEFFVQLKEYVTNDEDYGLFKELYEFCVNNPEFEVIFGKGDKLGTFQVRVKKLGKVIPVGVNANGKAWLTFRDANRSWMLPEQIEKEFKNRWKVPETTWWTNIHLKDRETLDKIKTTLEWLAESA